MADTEGQVRGVRPDPVPPSVDLESRKSETDSEPGFTPRKRDILKESKDFVDDVFSEFGEDCLGLKKSKPRYEPVLEYLTELGDKLTVYESSSDTILFSKADHILRWLGDKSTRPDYFLEVDTGDGFSRGYGFDGDLDEVEDYLSKEYEGEFLKRPGQEGSSDYLPRGFF